MIDPEAAADVLAVAVAGFFPLPVGVEGVELSSSELIKESVEAWRLSMALNDALVWPAMERVEEETGGAGSASGVGAVSVGVGATWETWGSAEATELITGRDGE